MAEVYTVPYKVKSLVGDLKGLTYDEMMGFAVKVSGKFLSRIAPTAVAPANEMPDPERWPDKPTAETIVDMAWSLLQAGEELLQDCEAQEARAKAKANESVVKSA